MLAPILQIGKLRPASPSPECVSMTAFARGCSQPGSPFCPVPSAGGEGGHIGLCPQLAGGSFLLTTGHWRSLAALGNGTVAPGPLSPGISKQLQDPTLLVTVPRSNSNAPCPLPPSPRNVLAESSLCLATLILTQTHFTDVKTEAQGGEALPPRSQSRW